MLIFSLGFSVPFYATRGLEYIVKEFGLDVIARALARKLLTRLGDGIINSINNLGLEKGEKAPGFVQNWKKFLSDAQTIGINQFRSQLNYVITKGILCDDLKGPLAFAFQASSIPYVDVGQTDLNDELKQGALTPFQTKIKCTIPADVREKFKKNFEKGGGWETWSRIVEPQNNLAGALVISLEELNKQRGSQENARQGEIVAGQGFTGVQSSCRGAGSNAQCTFLGKTVTPAKLLGEGAANWLEKNSEFLVNADELSEIIMAVINAAINKLANFVLDKTGFTAVSPGTEDKAASQTDTYGGNAQTNCYSFCFNNERPICISLDLNDSNPNSVIKTACYNRADEKCKIQCALPQ